MAEASQFWFSVRVLPVWNVTRSRSILMDSIMAGDFVVEAHVRCDVFAVIMMSLPGSHHDTTCRSGVAGGKTGITPERAHLPAGTGVAVE